MEATEGRPADGFTKLFGAFGGILSVFLFRHPGTSGSSLALIIVAHLFDFLVCEIGSHCCRFRYRTGPVELAVAAIPAAVVAAAVRSIRIR